MKVFLIEEKQLHIHRLIRIGNCFMEVAPQRFVNYKSIIRKNLKKQKCQREYCSETSERLYCEFIVQYIS